MDGLSLTSILLLFFFVAMVYSSVGHAGASGYTAVMAIFGLSAVFIRPTSLVLNICVGVIALYRFYVSGLIDVRKVLPFLVASLPAAFFSARLQIDKSFFNLVLGGLLLVSAIKFLFNNFQDTDYRPRKINILLAVFCGAIIGTLSGLTGTGGAIFFSPLLMSMQWATPREISGLSIVFVLANSISGLAGLVHSKSHFPPFILYAVVVVCLGAVVGSYFGAKRFSNLKLKKILGLVLLIASIKLLSQIS